MNIYHVLSTGYGIRVPNPNRFMNHHRRRHHHRHHPHPHPSLFVTSLDNPGPVDEHMGLLGFSCWLLSPSHHNQADSLGTAHKHLVKNHLGHTDLERVLNISVARLHRLHHLSECLLETAAYDASNDMDWHGWFVPAPEQTWELAVSVSVSISGAVEFSSISGTTTHSTKSKSVMHAANPQFCGQAIFCQMAYTLSGSDLCMLIL